MNPDHHPVYAKALAKRDALLRQLEDCRWELDQYEVFLALYVTLHEEPESREDGGYAVTPDEATGGSRLGDPVAPETAASIPESPAPETPPIDPDPEVPPILRRGPNNELPAKQQEAAE